MSLVLLSLLGDIAVLCLALAYRAEWLAAIARGSAMLSKANQLETDLDRLRGMYRREVALRFSLPTTLDQLPDAKVAAIYDGLRRGFPDERTEEMPSWVPIGTMGNPLQLVRVTDSSLNDTARYGELRDFFSWTVEP